jgi:SpoVK/Ycf46/Vps4 family AAA+-type ATPase
MTSVATPSASGSEPQGSLSADLRAVMLALHGLDALLAKLIRGQPAEAGPLAGMYVSPQEAGLLLQRSPCAPPFGAASGVGRVLGEPLRFAELVRQCGLSDFDLSVFLIALAPELDLRYERLYGFLQDDVTRRRATVDLALNLCTSSAEDKIARLAHFTRDAPLVNHAIVHVVPDPRDVQPPLLAHILKVDDQIVRALLGGTALDARLAAFCRFCEEGRGGNASPVATDILPSLKLLLRRARERGGALALHFHGPLGAGQIAVAEAAAAELEAVLLYADLGHAPERADEFDAALRVLFREARFKGAVPYLDRVDALSPDGRRQAYESVLEAVARHDGLVIIGTERAAMPAGVQALDLASVAFTLPGVERRLQSWQSCLAELSIAASPTELDVLSSRFALSAPQIRQAAHQARGHARLRAARSNEIADDANPTLDDLCAAARAQGGHELEKLTRKIEPKQGWDDIVLPPDQEAQLREICDQARYRHLVMDTWGFNRKLSFGKGLNVLFSGPPGTGKSMAAEVVAGELQIDLYKIDLSQVVSKYIGETEKNLDRIFDAATDANAILFFDEADALFGKRSEVRDAHDRYANIEIGYLLQKIEEYEGIAVLATNLRQNLDDAFLRRLRSIVEFPFPDEESRRRIWQKSFPRNAPLGDDVDIALLAREVRLSGGYIKNIALLSAFYAAADSSCIGIRHVVLAVRREHEKLGRGWDSSRFLSQVNAATDP